MSRRRTLFAKRVVAPNTFSGPDDSYLAIRRIDISGGMNNKQHPSMLGEKEVKNLRNVDLTTVGKSPRRPGQTLVQTIDTDVGLGLFDYDPQGGTEYLLAVEDTNIWAWNGTGTFSSVFTTLTTGLLANIVKAFKTGVGDVAILFNGTDNPREITPSLTTNDLGSTSGTGSDSPPKSTVATFYRNRLWVLKNDILYFSDAAPSDYSTAFDTVTNNYRIPVGSERALVGTRDLGLIVVGKQQIWALDPSVTPAATDKPEKLTELGCAAGNTFVQGPDDYYYLSFDGVRGIVRNEQDKLRFGESKPLSYKLKTEFEAINWNYISNACAVYWDNKYFISLPTSGATHNNQVWVYYPATQGWMVITGWNIARFSKFKLNGQELLYGIDSTGGSVYRLWSGASDNGNAVDYLMEGRNEDLGYPLIRKVGGELKVVATPSGNYNISVYGSFDNGAYVLLGYLNVSSNLISFPTSFPVLFYPDAESYNKFHLDSYGPWYQFRYKIEHNAVTTNATDIEILEVSLTAHGEEYILEETA